jgi:hypothetical protein
MILRAGFLVSNNFINMSRIVFSSVVPSFEANKSVFLIKLIKLSNTIPPSCL